MSKVKPMAYSTSMVAASTTGIISKMTALARSDRRNRLVTIMASASPIKMLSVTLLTAVLTKSAWT
jgi:hypothetical protein